MYKLKIDKCELNDFIERWELGDCVDCDDISSRINELFDKLKERVCDYEITDIVKISDDSTNIFAYVIFDFYNGNLFIYPSAYCIRVESEGHRIGDIIFASELIDFDRIDETIISCFLSTNGIGEFVRPNELTDHIKRGLETNAHLYHSFDDFPDLTYTFRMQDSMQRVSYCYIQISFFETNGINIIALYPELYGKPIKDKGVAIYNEPASVKQRKENVKEDAFQAQCDVTHGYDAT